MLGATGKASERERIRIRCTITNTDEDRVKTSIYMSRVEKFLLRSQLRGVVSGYSRTRAGDGARGLARSKEQGDGRTWRVDPLGREHSGV